jgi:hypothetical protein
MTPIQTLINQHGGPVAFRQALAARGLKLSPHTVRNWSAPGKNHREPDPAKVEMLTRLLKGKKP